MVPFQKTVKAISLTILCNLLVSTLAQSQISERPGFTIKVHIWGQVKEPGLYSVPSNTDIMELLSLAGGPAGYADLGKIKLVRRQGEDEKVFIIDLGKYLNEGDSTGLLILKPGDAVIVPKTSWYYWRTAIGLLSDIAVFVNLAILIQRLRE